MRSKLRDVGNQLSDSSSHIPGGRVNLRPHAIRQVLEGIRETGSRLEHFVEFRAVIRLRWVCDVEVEATPLDFRHRDAPCSPTRTLFVPPLPQVHEVLMPDRFRLRVLLTERTDMLVVPDCFRGRAFGEEDQIGPNRLSVRGEYSLGEADDCVDVALRQELLAQRELDVFAKQRAIRKHDGCPAARLKEMNYTH